MELQYFWNDGTSYYQLTSADLSIVRQKALDYLKFNNVQVNDLIQRLTTERQVDIIFDDDKSLTLTDVIDECVSDICHLYDDLLDDVTMTFEDKALDDKVDEDELSGMLERMKYNDDSRFLL